MLNCFLPVIGTVLQANVNNKKLNKRIINFFKNFIGFLFGDIKLKRYKSMFRFLLFYPTFALKKIDPRHTQCMLVVKIFCPGFEQIF
jgi:hypothetical protein